MSLQCFGRTFLELIEIDITRQPYPKVKVYGSKNAKKMCSSCGSTYCTCLTWSSNMKRVATHDDRNWLLTIYVVKYAVNHNGSSIFSQFPVSCLRKLNRITRFLPCNFFEWSFSSCAFMFLEYFTPVYPCKVCRILTSKEEFCRQYID